jgi:phage major head subunit gpT-like protein
MVITQARLDALRVQFSDIFQGAFQRTSAWASSLSTEVPSSAESNLYGFVDNTLPIREWLGERVLRTLEESDYRLVNKHWEGAVELSRNKIADDTLDLFATVTLPMFAANVAKWHDRQLSLILRDNAPCFDGGDFFDPAHPHPSGGTYSNSVELAFDAAGDAFASVRAMMQSFVDASGFPRFVGDRFTLVVPPILERRARVVVDAEWAPLGAVNAGTDGVSVQHATNVQRGMADVIVVPELAAVPANLSVATARWFLFATGTPLRALIVQNREAPELVTIDSKQEDGAPFRRNTNLYGVDFRSAYGVSMPWLAIASDPVAAMGSET